MITPEIGNSDISFWWLWRNSSLEMALYLTKGRMGKYQPVRAIDEVLDYFSDNVEDVTDDNSDEVE